MEVENVYIDWENPQNLLFHDNIEIFYHSRSGGQDRSRGTIITKITLLNLGDLYLPSFQKLKKMCVILSKRQTVFGEAKLHRLALQAAFIAHDSYLWDVNIYLCVKILANSGF